MGALLFGGISAISADIIAKLSTQQIYVGEKKAEITAYSINDNNYVKLRDIGEVLNFSVEYDEITDSVYIDRNSSCVESSKESVDYYATLQAEQYYHMFQSLYETSKDEINRLVDLKYIAFDTSKMKFENADILIKMFENFCDKNDFPILQHNFIELIDKGYMFINLEKECIDWNGIVFVTIEDIEVTSITIKTEVSIRYGDLAGFGAIYTAELREGKWIIKIVNEWMT